MALRNVNLDEIEERHLGELVELAVPEIRYVDYKRSLPQKSDAAEFLADVCSFANAGGGDLVYGVDEEGGIPTTVRGVQTADPDGDLLSMEQRILSGISPRIPGLRGRYVPLASSNHVFVLRVPRSFARPHAVYRSDTPRFVTRNSAGKHAMDVAEIRTSMLASESVSERMRSFRMGRLADIVAGETPVNLSGQATIALHLLPLAAFDSPVPAVDLDTVVGSPQGFLPIGSGGNFRRNFDGLLVHGSSGVQAEIGGRRPESYALLFRSGAIEAADSMTLWPEPDGPVSPSLVFERDLLDSAERYLALLSHLGVEGPIYVSLSLLGVAGYRMAAGRVYGSGISPVDRDALVVPEVEAESARLDRWAVESLMRAAFDQVWNACGYARSWRPGLRPSTRNSTSYPPTTPSTDRG